MSRSEIYNRLLWKEFREGLPILLFALLAPPLMFGFLPLVPFLARHTWSLAFIVTVGLPVLIILRMFNVVGGKSRVDGSERSRLPVGTLQEWITAFLVPALALAVAGAWIGAWSSSLINWSGMSQLALAWGVFLAAFYVCVRFLSRVLPDWAAVSCAVVWGLWMNFSVPPFVDGRGTDPLRVTSQVAEFNVWILAVAAVLSLLPALRGATAVRLTKLTAVALVIIVIPGPHAGLIKKEAQSMAQPLSSGGIDVIYSPDGSYNVVADSREVPNSMVRVRFRSHRSDVQRTRVFKQHIRLLGVHDARFVYFAQQVTPTARVQIRVWDTQEDTLAIVSTIEGDGYSLRARSLASIMRPGPMLPVVILNVMRAQALGNSIGVSPRGDYLVSAIDSSAGVGYDLWVTDLRTGKNCIVLANSFFGQTVAWTDTTLTLSGMGNPVIVDLNAMKAEVRIIPSVESGNE